MMGQTLIVKRTLLLLTAMLATLIVASGVALAVNKVCPSGSTQANPCSGTKKIDTLIGTNGPDYIKGLKGNDNISGGAGDDTTDGGAGNDTYSYNDDWGTGTLTDASGTDALNLSAVGGSNGGMTVRLLPELGENFVTDPNGVRINLSSSTIVEKVTGSSGFDSIRTGGATNTLQPGPKPDGGGLNATLIDLGGCSFSSFCPSAAIPASNDTYSGFAASGYGSVHIRDYGGTADKLVLPFASTDVYFEALGNDLFMATSDTDSVQIFGQLAPESGQNGHIEQIQFTDGTLSIGSETPQAQTLSASRTAADSAEAQVQKLNEASSLDAAEKEKLSKAAKKMIAEAQKMAQDLDEKLAASGAEEKR